MKKDRYEDGIDFQWGDTKYDCSFLDEAGGKYHRNNPDGSITEFKPPQLRMKTAIGLLDSRFRFTVRRRWDLLVMESKKDAEAAALFVNDHEFLISRGVSAEAAGRELRLFAIDVVMECTYFPGRGPE